jgi:hypothetical protein
MAQEHFLDLEAQVDSDDNIDGDEDEDLDFQGSLLLFYNRSGRTWSPPILNLDDISTDVHTRRALSEVSLSIVNERYPDAVLKGSDLFDASLFRDPTSSAVFYTFIAQLKRSIDAATPTPTHRFIKTLDAKKKLLGSYTQNIDGLEARVSLLGTACQAAKSNGKGKSRLRIKEVRNVQLHGDIRHIRRSRCSAEYPCSEDHLSFFEKGIVPNCPECLQDQRLVLLGPPAQSMSALCDLPSFSMMKLIL